MAVISAKVYFLSQTALRLIFLISRKYMNLLNELGNELALAFLVEKKHAEKIHPENAAALINKVKEVLELDAEDTREKETKISSQKAANSFSH